MTSSVFGGLYNVVNGVFESIFAVFQHVWHLLLGIVHTAWSAVEGIVNAIIHTFTGLLSMATHVLGDTIGILTANIVPISLVVVGVVLASVFGSGKNGGSASKATKKVKSTAGRKKRA